VSLLHRRTFARSLAAAQKLVELRPRGWLGHANLGHVRFYREEWKEAFDAYSDALALLSGSPASSDLLLRTVMVMMAACRMESGDVASARSLLERADAAPGQPPQVPDTERKLRQRLAALDAEGSR